MLSRYITSFSVGIGRFWGLLASEWDKVPSSLIRASETAYDVSRWLVVSLTVCRSLWDGTSTNTVSGIYSVRTIVSTRTLSAVETTRRRHGVQEAASDITDSNTHPITK